MGRDTHQLPATYTCNHAIISKSGHLSLWLC